MESNVFWKLVRHEFSLNGNRKKSKKRPFNKTWATWYVITIILLFFVIMTFVSKMTDFTLNNTWFVTMGFPYFLFFFGFGLVKKEWDNETQGWWLTLPYSRLTILGAKFVANILQILLILAGLLVLGFIYAIYITSVQGDFSGKEVADFMLIGCNWFILIALLSPFIMSLGQFLSIAHYTVLKVITPILWFVFMGGGSFFYWGFGIADDTDSFMSQFANEAPTSFIFSYKLLIIVGVSWVLTYCVLKLTAYLLEKRLSI